MFFWHWVKGLDNSYKSLSAVNIDVHSVFVYKTNMLDEGKTIFTMSPKSLCQLDVHDESSYSLAAKPNYVRRTCFECRSLLHVHMNAHMDAAVYWCCTVAAWLNCAHLVPTEAWLRWGSWHVMASGQTPGASCRSHWCRPDRRSSLAWCLPWTQWYVPKQASHMSVLSLMSQDE